MIQQQLRMPAKYGITERKKNELDTLLIQVLNAEMEVEKCQAIVIALTEKQERFEGFLAGADANRAATLNHLNLVKQLLQSALSLKENSDTAFNEIALAKVKTGDLATQVKNAIDMLIFSAEVVNKLASMVIRKKALNPLISDELVSRINKAGTDANNAVALTLVALQSSFTAQATCIECEGTSSLEFAQSIALYELLSGEKTNGDNTQKHKPSLFSLLNQAYNEAKKAYDLIQTDNNRVTVQLNNAQTNLSKAQVKMKSFKAGLAAANAAALA